MRSRLRSAAAAAIVLVVPGLLQAQVAGPPVTIRDLEGLRVRDQVRTPDYDYSTNIPDSPTRAREWVRLMTEYETTPEWIDELSFRYFALALKTEGSKREFTLFRGTVTYADIPEDRDHLSVMFLRPRAVERYGEIVAIAVEISHGGNVVAARSEAKPKLPEKWWTNPQLTPRDGYLLNRLQTPFAFINYDDYEFIKK